MCSSSPFYTDARQCFVNEQVAFSRQCVNQGGSQPGASWLESSSTVVHYLTARHQSVLGISRDSDGFLSPLCGGIVSSMSEPHLPFMSSNLDSPPLETPPSEERSPFTSIPVGAVYLVPGSVLC